VQAYAVGATDVLERPFDRKALLMTLLGDIGSLVGDSSDLSISNSEGILAGVGALRGIFDSLISGRPVELEGVHAAGEVLISNIEAEGLARWIDVVRKHHSQTYQHCLLVTGAAVGFGRHLGFSSSDTQRLAFAGLLHDIGKAGIPVAILEKPSPLDEHETAIMMRHPQLGFDALRGMPGLDLDILEHGGPPSRISRRVGVSTWVARK
jgi:HD-GYP domain-containing protein (c-di-GMP phosphodiesterase class II)